MYYVLSRNPEEYLVVSCTEGADPLYGNGSWSLKLGPYNTWKEATIAIQDAVKENKDECINNDD